jgi:hypothetical protein
MTSTDHWARSFRFSSLLLWIPFCVTLGLLLVPSPGEAQYIDEDRKLVEFTNADYVSEKQTEVDRPL